MRNCVIVTAVECRHALTYAWSRAVLVTLSERKRTNSEVLLTLKKRYRIEGFIGERENQHDEIKNKKRKKGTKMKKKKNKKKEYNDLRECSFANE